MPKSRRCCSGSVAVAAAPFGPRRIGNFEQPYDEIVAGYSVHGHAVEDGVDVMEQRDAQVLVVVRAGNGDSCLPRFAAPVAAAGGRAVFQLWGHFWVGIEPRPTSPSTPMAGERGF